MKVRFSLRRLLLLVTLIAVVCFFVVRPTMLATQLVSRVNGGDFGQVDSLGLRKQIWNYKRENGEIYSYDEFRIEAELKPRSWKDIRQFRRRVAINVWPPQHASHLSGMTGVYVFVRSSGPQIGGEEWE